MIKVHCTQVTQCHFQYLLDWRLFDNNNTLKVFLKLKYPRSLGFSKINAYWDKDGFCFYLKIYNSKIENPLLNNYKKSLLTDIWQIHRKFYDDICIFISVVSVWKWVLSLQYLPTHIYSWYRLVSHIVKWLPWQQSVLWIKDLTGVCLRKF